jgi:hypothetical protein
MLSEAMLPAPANSTAARRTRSRLSGVRSGRFGCRLGWDSVTNFVLGA